jgi:ribosomal protein S14
MPITQRRAFERGLKQASDKAWRKQVRRNESRCVFCGDDRHVYEACPYMCPLCRRSLHTQIAVANAILLTIHLKSRAIVIVPAGPGKCIVGKILETAAAVGRSRPGFDVHQVLMIPPLFLGNGICCDLSSRPVARFFYERWAGEQQI